MSQALPPLMLASRSPRRVELMREWGYQFSIDPADIDEDNVPSGLNSAELAKHLALAKASAVAPKHPDSVVIGSDTVVFVRGEFLAKPVDADDARRMMRMLSDSRHEVVTGVALVHHASGQQLVESDITYIDFRQITEAEIEQHIASNNWQGKAGGYGLQHKDPFVTQIEGEPTNVVGLPMPMLRVMLSSFAARLSK
jgi:septum formation protein